MVDARVRDGGTELDGDPTTSEVGEGGLVLIELQVLHPCWVSTLHQSVLV